MEMLGWLFTFCLQNGNPLKSNFVYQIQDPHIDFSFKSPNKLSRVGAGWRAQWGTCIQN